MIPETRTGRGLAAGLTSVGRELADPAADEASLRLGRFDLQCRPVGGHRLGAAVEPAQQLRAGDVRLRPAGKLRVMAHRVEYHQASRWSLGHRDRARFAATTGVG